MNEFNYDIDVPEDELLNDDVSDEVLELAAGIGDMAAPTPTYWTSSCYASCCQQ